MKKTGKVGYILRKFPVLSETFVLNEILQLESQGIEVHIFSLEKPNDPKFHPALSKLKASITYIPDLLKWKTLWKSRKKTAEQYPEGYRHARMYALKQGNPALLLRFLQSCCLCNVAKKEKITHFHAHFATRAATIAFLSSMIQGKPYSFTAHAVDIFKESLCQRALSRKIEYAKFVITVSDYNKEFLSAKFPFSIQKLIKVYNGIDLNQFSPSETVPEGPFTFLCVARFVEKKGHRVLVDACAILKAEGLNFRCLMIGKGKLQSQIEKAIKEKQLGEWIEILGAKTHDEVRECFKHSHCYILPCTTGENGNKDGLPVAIVEALACGLPVITTPMTGNPEVVKDGRNGFLVPFDNPRKTADAMKLLMSDQQLYRELSQNARPSIEDKFDINRTVSALVNKFKESVG